MNLTTYLLYNIHFIYVQFTFPSFSLLRFSFDCNGCYCGDSTFCCGFCHLVPHSHKNVSKMISFPAPIHIACVPFYNLLLSCGKQLFGYHGKTIGWCMPEMRDQVIGYKLALCKLADDHTQLIKSKHNKELN